MALLPVIAVVLVAATAAWVYTDAKAHALDDRPVTFTLGDVQVSAPEAWAVGCLVLWVLVFPVYLVARRFS
jgi:hypothetical protein